MRHLNCLIVDDEPIAREGIRDYCEQIRLLHVVALCKNVFEASKYLERNQIDLIFLDINMPIQSGIEWLKGLKNSPAVIMTTAYKEHALESYEYNVLDYLVKPIPYQRFVQAVNKVRSYLDTNDETNTIFLKSERHIKKVHLSDVLYVEAMQNYIKVVTTEGTIVTQASLKSIKELLPDKDFIQTHKSYIVSKHQVDQIVNNHVIIGKYKIPISVRLKKSVLNSFRHLSSM